MKSKFYKSSLLSRILITTAAILTLAFSTASAEEPIRMGVLQPLTGQFTKNGTEHWAAMQIARDMINERGGINGRKIEYILADIPTAAAAISETERLITREKVKITTGSGLSPLAIAVSQAAERHKVFHWETVGAAEVITRRGFKYTFQVGGASRLYAQAALDFTLEELAPRLKKAPTELRIAMLWENRALGKSIGDGVRQHAKDKGVKLVYDEGYDTFITDMTAIVQKLKDVNPDVLIAVSYPNDAILFQRKAKELNFYVSAMVAVTGGYSNPDLRDAIGNSVLGIFVSEFPPRVNPHILKPETREAAEEFYKRYSAAMGRAPAGHASASFSGLWGLFTEVFPKAKTFEPDELREIALSLDLPIGSLPNGSGIKFTNNDWAPEPKDAGQNLLAAIGVWQWQTTGNNEVYPKQLATDEPILVPLPAWDARN
ncbi:ABC transporter substrate-binding protein [Parapusillimonas sp. SGNA-6]|nr:ABC transporter substrate-binding protein [Parapusillimonas sp. SGNA-6]